MLFYTKNLIFIFLALIIFTGCNKDKNEIEKKKQTEIQKQMEQEDDTTSLSPSESFGAVLTQNILNDDTEVELESYLSEVIFPLIGTSEKATIDKISSSLYIIKYGDSKSEKNLLIEKFYNPKTDEISFEYTETTLNSKKQFLK